MKVLLQELDARLQRLSPLAITAIGLCLVLAFGVLDYYTPRSMSFTLIYMLIVAFVGWYAGRWPAAFVAGAVVITAAMAQWILPRSIPHPVWVVWWNIITRLLAYGLAGWVTAQVASLNRNLKRSVEERTARWKAEAEEHKATAGRLSEALERFQQVVHNISEVFWLSDVPKSQIVYVSPAYERVWGRKCEELYRESRSWAATIHPADRDEVVRRAQTDQAAGNYDIEYRIIRPDGAVRWIRDRAFPVRNEQGEVYRIAGIADDITERQQTREVLQTQAAILENIAEGVVVTDEQGVIVQMNPAAERIWGYERNEMIGQPASVFSALPEPERTANLQEVLAALRTTGSWRGTFKNRRKDGTIIICDAVMSRLEIQGRVLYIAVEQDVTERNWAEEALRQSEEAFRVFMNAVPEPALLLDRNGIVLVGNPAMARNLGLAQADLPGRCIFDLLPPEAAARRKAMFNQVVATGTAVRFEDERGDRAFINWVSPVLDSTGKVSRVAALAFDITARKRAELTTEAFLVLGTKLSTAANPLDAAKAIFETADLLWKWDCGALDICLPQSNQTETLLAWDVLDGKRCILTPAEPNRTPSGRARRILRQGAELILRQPGEKPNDDFIPIGDTSRLSASLMNAPIRREGQPVGVFSIQSYTRDAYTPEDLRTLQALADYCGGALERLSIEESARQREALNRTILATAMDGYYILDFAADRLGAFVEANEAYCRMTGYTREELLRMRITDLEAIESPAEVARHNEKTLAQHGDRFETRHRRKDGQEVHLEISVSLLPGQAGSTFSFVRDITQRKQAERALAQREQHYRTLFELSPDGILLEDTEGQILDANQALCQTFGYSREELVGRNVRCLVPPDAHAEVEEHLATLRSGQMLAHELWNVRKNGERCLMWLNEKPLALPDGRQGVLVVARDVTQSRRAELTKETFLTLGTKLSAVGTPVEAAKAIYASADQLWKWDTATLSLYSPESDWMEPVLFYDVMDGERDEVAPPFAAGAPTPRMRRIMQHGAELILRKEGDTPDPDAVRFGDISRVSASVISVPMRREGQPVGVLSIQSYTPDAFTREDLRTLQALGDYCGGAMERIRAEHALRQREEVNRTILTTAMDGFYALDFAADPGGAITEVNDAFCRLNGYSRQELLQMRIIDLETIESPEEVARHKDRIMATGADRFETRHRRKNGQEIYVEISLSKLVTGRQQVFGFVRDITERKRAELAKEAFLSLGAKLSAARTPWRRPGQSMPAPTCSGTGTARRWTCVRPSRAWLQTVLNCDVVDGQRREVRPGFTRQAPLRPECSESCGTERN